MRNASEHPSLCRQIYMGVVQMTKSYVDLEKEVWKESICSGCGACVAVCPADAIFFQSDSKAPVNCGYCKVENDSVPCGACSDVCPRKTGNYKGGLGEFSEIISARAAIEVKKSQSGGAVTAILANALDEGVIDAVVTITEDPWTLKPESAIITRKDILITKAGSRYSWHVPILESLKEAVINRKIRKIAVVGLPCAISAVRLMKESENDLLRPFGDSIRLMIGLFCTESFDYNLFVHKIRGGFDLETWEIKRIDIKGHLEMMDLHGGVYKLEMDELEGCIRRGCRVCTDFTAVDSDISAGSVGTPDGVTTLIVRNDTGGVFIERAVTNGSLIIRETEVNMGIIKKLAEKKSKRS